MQAVGGAALTTHEKVETDGTPPTIEIDPASRTRAWRWFGLVAFAVIVLDLVTKHLTVTELADRGPVRLLGDALRLVHVRNSGAAFSLGQDYTWVFPIVAIGVVGWILWMASKLASAPWAVALGFVLGGALGNLGDRIFRAPGPFVGHVVDMVSVYEFPVFNVADSALTVGVALAVLLEFTGRRRDGSRVAKEDDSSGRG